MPVILKQNHGQDHHGADEIVEVKTTISTLVEHASV